MNLLIVESPTKAKTLGRFLGKDFAVEATMGHIKDLPKSKLGVDLEKDFAPDYQIVENKLPQIEILQKAAKKAKVIYLATDPDREGEAIAAHVKELLKNGVKQKRIVFHEITAEAVEEAIKHPRGVDKNLVDAQIARRVLDRLVGYQLSPLLWKKIRRGLSAGRVQSVAVRLIVEREREIEKFKKEEYWEIYADVKPKKSAAKNQFRVQLAKTEVKNRSQADNILADLRKADYKVADIKKRTVRKKPYAPFTTSTMTQTAARLFSWSAKKTMSVAQKLYEEGLITYHRTDSTNIATTAMTKVRKFIKIRYGQKYLSESARVYKTRSKTAQEAHEAVRPTNAQKESRDLKFSGKFANDSKKLYDLIWRRFVACQMAEAVFDETRIEVAAKNKNNYLLTASGQIMQFEGWRKVIPRGTSQDEQLLPELKKDQALSLIKAEGLQKFTQPPPRYNEASLIKTLEKLGIGRPSTYAPTISTIRTRQYVEKTDGKFLPTPVGVAVNNFLIKNFPDIFEYEFTAEMEDDLDKVAEGEKEWNLIIKNFWGPFAKKLKSVEKEAKRVKIETEKLNKKCPKCGKENGGELVVRIGRFGKFVSCSRFPDCDFTDKYVEKIGMKCPKCKKGDIIVKKTGKGRRFFGCSRYPDCDFASWKNPKLEKKKKDPKAKN